MKQWHYLGIGLVTMFNPRNFSRYISSSSNSKKCPKAALNFYRNTLLVVTPAYQYVNYAVIRYYYDIFNLQYISYAYNLKPKGLSSVSYCSEQFLLFLESVILIERWNGYL